MPKGALLIERLMMVVLVGRSLTAVSVNDQGLVDNWFLTAFVAQDASDPPPAAGKPAYKNTPFPRPTKNPLRVWRGALRLDR